MSETVPLEMTDCVKLISLRTDRPIRRRYMAKRCPESDDSTVVTVVEESDDMEEAETPDVEEAEKVVDAPAPKKVGWWDRRRKGKEADHSV